jgi:hypothetical protein
MALLVDGMELRRFGASASAPTRFPAQLAMSVRGAGPKAPR